MRETFELAPHADGRLELLRCRALAERGVPHGFSLRRTRREGGRPFGLRGREGEELSLLGRALGLARLVSMRQVHGARIRRIDGDDDAATRPEADGLLTTTPGIGLLVQTADCVPLLLWSEASGAAAAVHAGWRGTLAGIAGLAAVRLAEAGGAPADLRVAIGPAIGACCYEVGPDVEEAFRARWPDAAALFRPGPRGRPHLDLVEANRRQLVAAGVPAARIEESGICTACHADLCYSYRRDGAGAGRLLAVVAATDRARQDAPGPASASTPGGPDEPRK